MTTRQGMRRLGIEVSTTEAAEKGRALHMMTYRTKEDPESRPVIIALLALLAVVAVGCGSKGDTAPPFEVETSVVSHQVTQDISVWAPEGVGSWPIVYAIHGNGADRSRWDVTGPALAAQGVVVFAPDYRSTEPWNYEEDIECSWRYVASIAAEYGGDLDQPITFVGHSLGATMVLVAGLDEEAYGLDGMYDGCLSAAPMPNVIVPISGFRYEYGGDRYDFTSRVAGASNTEANLVLVVGSEDASCEPWQSQDATGALQSAGYSARFVEIDGADHLAVIAKEVIDGQVVTLPDTPAGDKVVQTILEVIDAAGT